MLNRLDKIVAKYGDNRRTGLLNIAKPSKAEKEIAEVVLSFFPLLN